MTFETFITFIEAYGYYAVFILLMVGMIGIIPVPEETSLVFIGFLVSKGDISFGLSILFAFLGTISGMTTAYMIGGRVGSPFVRKYGKKFGITQERLSKAENWFKQYGKFTLAIGYFIPGLRQITAYTVGINRLPYKSFAFMAYVGAAVWITVFISLGAYLGENWQLLMPMMHRYAPWILFCLLLVFTIYIFIKKKFL